MTDCKEIEVRGYKLFVSRDGTVRLPEKRTKWTCMRLGVTSTKTAVFKERVLKPSITKMGYQEVTFVHDRKTFKFSVHRLVAQAFVPGYSPDLVVNHLNGNKLDNRPENLEWTTKGQNTKHAWENNLIPLRGSQNPSSKLNEEQVAWIRRLLNDGVPVRPLSKALGVSDSLIYLIQRGDRWPHIEAA